MTDSRERISLDLDETLLNQIDVVADIEGMERKDVIDDALHNYIEVASESEQFRQRIAEAYYDDRVGLDTVETLVGTEQARTFQLLKRDLEDEPLGLGDPDESIDIYDTA